MINSRDRRAMNGPARCGEKRTSLPLPAPLPSSFPEGKPLRASASLGQIRRFSPILRFVNATGDKKERTCPLPFLPPNPPLADTLIRPLSPNPAVFFAMSVGFFRDIPRIELSRSAALIGAEDRILY